MINNEYNKQFEANILLFTVTTIYIGYIFNGYKTIWL